MGMRKSSYLLTKKNDNDWKFFFLNNNINQPSMYIGEKRYKFLNVKSANKTTEGIINFEKLQHLYNSRNKWGEAKEKVCDIFEEGGFEELPTANINIRKKTKNNKTTNKTTNKVRKNKSTIKKNKSKKQSYDASNSNSQNYSELSSISSLTS